jgi:hypothetical protein
LSASKGDGAEPLCEPQVTLLFKASVKKDIEAIVPQRGATVKVGLDKIVSDH